LVINPQSKPIHQLTHQHISIREKYLQPQGLVFDPLSVESAKQWLETTAFEEAGSSYINTRSTVVVAEIMRAHHLSEELQQPRAPQPSPPPAPNQQAPFVFQIGPILRTIVTLYILQNVLNYPLAWVIPVALLYYMYNSGLLERLMKMLFPSLFQVINQFLSPFTYLPSPIPSRIHLWFQDNLSHRSPFSNRSLDWLMFQHPKALSWISIPSSLLSSSASTQGTPPSPFLLHNLSHLCLCCSLARWEAA
jgi:hypothetical protein